jgi:hypothetical protein
MMYTQNRTGSSSLSSSDTQATRRGAWSARHHWASSVVLPDPAGASTRHSLPRTPASSSPSSLARWISPARAGGGRSLVRSRTGPPGMPAPTRLSGVF